MTVDLAPIIIFYWRNEILARRLTLCESLSNAVERKLELKSPDLCDLLKPTEVKMYVRMLSMRI